MDHKEQQISEQQLLQEHDSAQQQVEQISKLLSPTPQPLAKTTMDEDNATTTTNSNLNQNSALQPTAGVSASSNSSHLGVKKVITKKKKLRKKNISISDELLRKLKNMDSSSQLQLWIKLIDNHPFNLNQLRSLQTAIDERIKVDIISNVPYEIALYIMSFLEPKDLCQAAQTCHSWRTVCEDNRLWREKCKEEGILDDKQTLDALTRKRIIKKHEKQEAIVNESLANVPKSEWKQTYLKHMSILRNWRTRRIEISEPFISTNSNDRNNNNANSNIPNINLNNNINEPLHSDHHHHHHQHPPLHHLYHPHHHLHHHHHHHHHHHDHPIHHHHHAHIQVNITNNNNNQFIRINDNNNLTAPNSNIPNNNSSTKHLMQLRCHEESVITCLQYNPKTNTIVSGSDDQTLKVWSSETGRCITTLEGHTGGVWSSQLSPEDIVISGSTDRTLKVWKAHTGQLLHSLHGHTSTVRCLALDGNYVVSGSRDTTLRLWDVKKGVCKHVFLGHSAAVRCVEYKNDIIVSGAYDHLVMVWDAKTGLCCHALEGHFSRIYSLQFDGKTVASGSLDSTICIWDAPSGKLKHRLEGHQSLTSKMQLKGNLLVSANADSYCKVWNINTGQCLQTLGGPYKHSSAITSVHFNNRHVVTSSDDGTVKLWDIRTGRFIRDLVVLPTASQGGVVWRIRASYTKLICAVGSRMQTEDTHLLVLDFND